jgi:hypothetical protein
MAQTSTSVTKTPQRYTYAQLQQLWIQAGGDKFIAPVMAAIALAESSGNPNATHTNQGGSVDRGLWQINSSHGKGTSSYNPQANARQAVAIYRTQGLTAWTTFTGGQYLKYLQVDAKGKQAVNSFLQKNPQIGAGKGPAANPPSLVTKGLQAIPGAEQTLHPIRTVQDAASGAVSGVESTLVMGLREAMYAFAIFGGLLLVLLGLGMIGLDIGLGGFQKVNRHPVVRYVNRRTSSGGSSGPTVEDTSTGDLPGPEA